MTGFPGKLAAPPHLQQIIAALTEGVILVAPDGAFVWADDTALTMHGVRSLKEMGGNAEGFAAAFALAYRDGQELRPDQYPVPQLLAGHPIDRALFTVTDRANGRRWVHEIRTLALKDAEGRGDGFVVILNDETERFNAEERFERAFSANPAPAIIARLSDMRYVKVNHGFLELTGYTSGMLLGHSMHEIDVLRGAEKRDQAVRRLHAGATIPQMEGCLLMQDGRDKTVLLGGQPIQIGDQPCMLFTFADLHPRQQAQDALRASEERFAKAFRMAPGPMAMMTLDGLRVLDVNAAFTAATGWRREEVIGRTEAELGLWGEHPAREEVERQIRSSGHVGSADVRVKSRDGVPSDYLLSADMVEIHGQHCVLSVMQDITERKQTETELLAAIDAVLQDTSWLGQKIVEKLVDLSRRKGSAAAQPDLAALPARAREVLGLIAQGLADEDIAARLGISRNTLRNHIAVIYDRLGVHKRGAVVVWARERGLGATAKSL